MNRPVQPGKPRIKVDREKAGTLPAFSYQSDNRYFAQVAEGLEPFVADEAIAAGLKEVTTAFKGVAFKGDKAALYRFVYNTRMASRVLAPLLRFTAHTEKVLYSRAQRLPWELFFGLKDTFSLRAHVHDSQIRHSRYALHVLKDAIADRFTDRFGRRPDVDTDNPTVLFDLYIGHNQITISLDLGAGSLHHRGYRKRSGQAPMRETTAAGVITHSQWTGDEPFYDPMCGSGTLLAEALMKHCRIPAAYLRRQFGFVRLPDFDRSVWEQVRRECDGAILPLKPGIIRGGDIDSQMLEISRTNLGMLPGGDAVSLSLMDVRERWPKGPLAVVTNPPYGLRLKGDAYAKSLLKAIGKGLKFRDESSTLTVYLGDRKLKGAVGLKPDRKMLMPSGGLDGGVYTFSIFPVGSKSDNALVKGNNSSEI